MSEIEVEMEFLFNGLFFAILFVLLGISFSSVNSTLSKQSERIDKIYEMISKEQILKERKNS